MKALLHWVTPLVWLLTSSVASAQQAHDRAGYGPASICVAGYAVLVHDGEAASISMRWGISIRGEEFDLLQARVETGFGEDRKFQASTVTLPGIGAITKYHYPRQMTIRRGLPFEMVNYEENDHWEYLLPAIGAEPAVRLTSTTFDGSNDDSMLERFSTRTSHCDLLNEDADGHLGGEVMNWSHTYSKGPAIVCEGALAIHIGAGEVAQRSWKERISDSVFVAWRIIGPDWQVVVTSSAYFKNKRRPTGPLDEIGYSFSPIEGGATLLPPASYPKNGPDDGIVYLTAYGLSEKVLPAFLDRMEYLAQRQSCQS